MGIELTKEQKNAVFCRGRNALVAAAAGSGKTRVLVERVMSRISGNELYNIDDFLIINTKRQQGAERSPERDISKRIRKTIRPKPSQTVYTAASKLTLLQ